jgi:hypothetical protein
MKGPMALQRLSANLYTFVSDLSTHTALYSDTDCPIIHLKADMLSL